MKNIFGKSIGHKLLKTVFSYYFIVTLILTSGHLYHEYVTTENSIVNQLNNIGNSFADSLQTALWDLDSESMESILTGIIKTDIVSGVVVTDASGQLEARQGVYISDGQRVKTFGSLAVEGGSAKEILVEIDGNRHQFYEYILRIEHVGDRGIDRELIGFAHLFSPVDLAMVGYKQSVYLIIVNAIIKTAALWVIFLYFSNSILSRPLLSLSKATFSFSGKNSESEALASVIKMTKSKRDDEVKWLSANFISMHETILERMANLKSLNDLAFSYSKVHQYSKALESTFVSVVEIFGFDDAVVFDEHRNVMWDSRDFHERSLIGKINMEGFYDSRMNVLNAKNKIVYGAFGVIEPEEVIKSTLWNSFLYLPVKTEDREPFDIWFLGKANDVHLDENSDLSKESTELLEVIANLLCVNLTRIRQSDAINESTLNLEKMVAERTDSLQEKTNDIISMLHNMHQGIFTIMNGGIVHHEYATYLEEILETQDISGENFIELLFSDSNVGSNAIDQVYSAVSLMMHEDEMVFNFNSHLLVTEYVKEVKSGNKMIELDWDPIFHDGVVDKMMVTVRDVTCVKVLQEEADSRRVELEIIGQILNVDRGTFVGFLNETFTFIDECRSIIENTDANDPYVVALLFRKMHTVKGNARTYGFHYITDTVHNVEQGYDDLRKDPEAPWFKDRLLDSLNEAEADVLKYQTIFTDKLGFEIGDGNDLNTIAFGEHDIDGFLDKFNGVMDASDLPPQIVDCLKESYYTIAQLKMKQLSEIVSYQIRMLASLSKEVGKPVPKVDFNVDGLFIKQEAWECLQNVFTHILRNAVDHGIEGPQERSSKGKRAYGKVVVDILDCEKALRLRVRDDGRGLPLGKLRAVARAQGLLGIDGSSNEEVSDLIFHSGISSAESVSQISGRGVGMDASKKLLEELGGKLSVQLLPVESGNAKALDFFPFEILIELPKDLYCMAPSFARSA